jgi:tetratricopeptide (TPR) repeat protein
MTEQSKLQRVFEGILSSQSFELLKNFSDAKSWSALSPEEKELLAQLFLLSAEASAQSGETEEIRRQSIQAYQTACHLAPNSARGWYRLGAYLALSESEIDLHEAVCALKKAVELDAGFFDAHYALASASLRLGVLRQEEPLLRESDFSFSNAHALVDGGDEGGSSAPAEFYWHWGIVWFLLARDSGEPVDLRRTLDLYEKARAKGLLRADFLNDYANAIVELALLTSNDALILDAVSLYSSAIEASDSEDATDHEKAIRLFNLGCCYHHLYELSHEKQYFESAEKSFSESSLLASELPAIWQRWGSLLFRSARLRLEIGLAQEAVKKFKKAEELGSHHPMTLALCSQALLWIGREQDRLDILNSAEAYAQRAMENQNQQGLHNPESWAASALCQYEYGYYFHDHTYFSKAIEILQKAIAEHPKSALLWHTIALARFAEADSIDSEKTLREALMSFLIASHSPYASLPSFWNDWGIALLTLADWTEDAASAHEAILKFETALELASDIASPWAYNLARAFDVLGDLTDDESCYERAIQILMDLVAKDPSCLPAVYQLAACYLHIGEVEDDNDAFTCAIEYFEQYLEKEPEDEYAWADYALSLIHRGEKERFEPTVPREWFQAEDALVRSMALGNDQALYHIGCLNALMGNFSEAMRFLYQALDRDVLPPLSEICDDIWLEPLFPTIAFQDFLKKIEEQHREEDRESTKNAES